jgi:hypothetical protein
VKACFTRYGDDSTRDAAGTGGVSGIRYSIGLDACAPYAVEAAVVDQLIGQEAGPWTK